MKSRNKPKREYKKCKTPGCNFVTRRSRVMRVHKKNCPRIRPTLRCEGHAHYSEVARAICRGELE